MVAFVMLNPSTADALEDDPTIRRCVGFAQSWGYGGILVVNLFSYRATNPGELAGVSYSEAVGEATDFVILSACADVLSDPRGRVVAAWGARSSLKHAKAKAYYDRRVREVTALLREGGVVLDCIKETTAGEPRHPLYLSGSLAPRLWGGMMEGVREDS